MSAVVIDSLSFSYGDAPILQGVTLSVSRGEFIGLIGPNGGGKTTLLKLLMGFLSPQQGSIQIFHMPPEKARFSIGYVPQAQRFDREFPITTLELIFMGALSQCKPLKKIPSPIEKKALHLIDRLGLGPHKQKAFGTLSGGLAQRALLARALLSDPPLLLLDEPTANIDPPSTALIFELLEELKGKKTILLVTHDVKTIIEKVDKVLCIEGSVSAFLPGELCEHFAFGLYHTPLLGLPPNHFKRKS